MQHGKVLLKGAVLGGVVAFLWSSLSWTVLPWHEKTLKGLPHESELVTAIKKTISEEGIYVIPWPTEGAASHEELKKQRAEGPTAFMVVQPQGVRQGMLAPMARSLLVNILIAGILTWLLLQTKLVGWVRRVSFVKMSAVSGAALMLFNEWNWWGFTGCYSLVNLIDVGITYGLVGLVLAKVVPTCCAGGSCHEGRSQPICCE